MTFIGFILLLSFIIWAPWLWRHYIQPISEKRALRLTFSNHPKKEWYTLTARLLNKLYFLSRAYSVSRHERKRLHIGDTQFTYGEIDCLSFIKIIELTAPQPNETFYDLGCGAGKAVLTAALTFELSSVIGIELLPGLCELARQKIKQAQTLIPAFAPGTSDIYLNRLKKIDIRQEDFLTCDLSSCDVLFINATCLSKTTWQKMELKLCALKQGARIIVTSYTLQGDDFLLVYQGKELMSWGINTVHIYRKITAHRRLVF